MTATFQPAREVVTTVPASVTVVMSPADAGKLRTLCGQARAGQFDAVFSSLDKLRTDGLIPKYTVEIAKTRFGDGEHFIPAINFIETK